MSQISLFAQEPLELLLKIKKAKSFIKKDGVNEVLFDGLSDCATQLELFSTKAISAQNERECVKALRNSYMKVASTRYYLEVLCQTGYIPQETAESMLADCDHIESRLQPLVELNDGKYDDMSDEEFYEALKDIFDTYLNDEEDISGAVEG